MCELQFRGSIRSGRSGGRSGGRSRAPDELSGDEGGVVVGCINTCSGVFHNGDSDSGPGLKCTELFEFLELFKRCWWQRCEFEKEIAAVGVEADVEQPRWCGRPSEELFDGDIATERNWAAAEVQGTAGVVEYYFYAVGIPHCVGGLHRCGDGGHATTGFLQFSYELGNNGGVEFRFIALEVYDGIGIMEAPSGDFSDAIGATVVCAGEFSAAPELQHHIRDFLAVGCDDDVVEFRTTAGRFPRILEQGFTGGVEQEFAGQAGGLKTSGDDADGFHGSIRAERMLGAVRERWGLGCVATDREWNPFTGRSLDPIRDSCQNQKGGCVGCGCDFIDGTTMRIFFSAGEPSGDQHGARLIGQLRAMRGDLEVEGFGGPDMRRAGCRLLFELTELAVMGFLRVLPLIRRFYGLVAEAERHFDAQPPDAVVLIDFPGFNWWIARAASRRGIPVFYYLPPQLWAWAPWRIRKVRRWVDHVLCALPFEYAWYQSRGVSSTWVGHPFFDQAAERVLRPEVMGEIRPVATDRVVALLPGSRGHEIEKNWPVMLEVIRRVSSAVPGVRWVVGSYREKQRQRCEELRHELAPELSLQYFVDATSEVISAADCCLMVSGSISLELLARRKPGIVLYRVPSVGRFFARFLMLCRYITLPNLMADAELFPEFVSNGNPEQDIRRMTVLLTEWLTQPRVLLEAAGRVAELADRTAAPGASRRTAGWLLEWLENSERSSVSKS